MAEERIERFDQTNINGAIHAKGNKIAWRVYSGRGAGRAYAEVQLISVDPLYSGSFFQLRTLLMAADKSSDVAVISAKGVHFTTEKDPDHTERAEGEMPQVAARGEIYFKQNNG